MSTEDPPLEPGFVKCDDCDGKGKIAPAWNSRDRTPRKCETCDGQGKTPRLILSPQIGLKRRRPRP